MSDIVPAAVIVADAHLQPTAWRGRSILQDAYYSFQQAVAYATNAKLPLVLLGDVLDTRVNAPQQIVFLSQTLKKFMDETNQPVLYIQGQHEGDPDDPWLQIVGGTHMHRQTYYLECGLELYGLDYQPHGQLQQELQKIPSTTDVLLAHQGWAEIAGEMLAPQGSLAEVPHVRLVLTGDYHKRELHHVTGASGQELEAHSPGSICMQSIDEPPEKFYGVLYSDGSVRYRPLRTRPFLEQVLTSEEDLQAAIEAWPGVLADLPNRKGYLRLPEALRKPLLRVRYYDGALFRRFKAVVKDDAFLFPKHVYVSGEREQKELDDLQSANAATGLTMPEALADALKVAAPQAWELASQLWDGRADPVAALQRWKSGVLADQTADDA